MAPPEKALTPNHMAQEQLPSLADIPLHHVNPRPRVAFMTAWINEPADFIGEPVLEALEDATSTASPTNSPAFAPTRNLTSVPYLPQVALASDFYGHKVSTPPFTHHPDLIHKPQPRGVC